MGQTQRDKAKRCSFPLSASSNNILILGLGCMLIASRLEAPPPQTTTETTVSALTRNNSADLAPSLPYQPSLVETYVLDHAQQLGYDQKFRQSPSGCAIWKDASLTNSTIHERLNQFRQELAVYKQLLLKFNGSVVSDVRTTLEDDPRICDSLELHPDGLPGIFQSGQLSQSSMGYLEPLLPPMRHPDLCFGNNFRKSLMDMGYIIHDFARMCRKLKRHSRIVLVDMGASLEFHERYRLAPAIYVAELYKLFGMPFDHIYAFEITEAEPADVYQKVPEHLMPSFHWINVGVDPDPTAKLNPLKSIVQHFNKDDLVVVKLDIDSPGIEEALAEQIRDDALLGNVIDQFYFEHHVFLAELNGRWQGGNRKSVQESLQLFQALRQNGIASHFWV